MSSAAAPQPEHVNGAAADLEAEVKKKLGTSRVRKLIRKKIRQNANRVCQVYLDDEDTKKLPRPEEKASA